MEVIYKTHVDWEPLVLTFHMPQWSAYTGNAIETIITLWFEKRSVSRICACCSGYASREDRPSDRTIVFSLEWMCSHCLPLLLEVISSSFTPIEAVEIGGDFPETIADRDYVLVPGKELTLENGDVESVSEFRIARVPVTLGEYSQFVERTGYVTTAEAEAANGSYNKHPGIAGLSKVEAEALPVTFVSFIDAMTYCAWNGSRLPTEAEWLSAAIVDNRIYDEELDYECLWNEHGRFKPALQPNALKFLGKEWTNTVVGDKVVVRAGPTFVRLTQWKASGALNRLMWPRDSYDVCLTFRVVAESNMSLVGGHVNARSPPMGR